MTGVLAEVHLPFAALEQALRPLLKRAGAWSLASDLPCWPLLACTTIPGAPDIFLVALATLTLLTESATRKPILLVADDAQWLDQATYDVLAFISRRLSSDPIVLLAAMRDGFNRSFGDASTLRHRLSGLDDADAERLLDAHAPDLSAELRSRFLKEASGNPLALVELPRGERRSGRSRCAVASADGAAGALRSQVVCPIFRMRLEFCCSWRQKTTGHRSTKSCAPAKWC